jgi:hypothetical protein
MASVLLPVFQKYGHNRVKASQDDCVLCGKDFPKKPDLHSKPPRTYYTPRQRNVAPELSICEQRHPFHTPCADEYVRVQRTLKDANDNPVKNVACPVDACGCFLAQSRTPRTPRKAVAHISTVPPMESPEEYPPYPVRYPVYRHAQRYGLETDSLDSIPEHHRYTHTHETTLEEAGLFYGRTAIANAFMRRGGSETAQETPKTRAQRIKETLRSWFVCGSKKVPAPRMPPSGTRVHPAW